MNPTSIRRRRNRTRVSCEPLESRELLTAMIALTDGNRLEQFDSSRPDLITASATISGLQNNETILAIDSRPATGVLYGLGSSDRLYSIDPASGAALAIGNAPLATPLTGTKFDIDFDPVSDRLRVVSDAGQDFRVNPDTGDVSIDMNLAYAASDPAVGTSPAVVGAAYVNNVAGAGTTTLVDLDAKRGALVSQGSIGGSPISPNSGQLFTIAPLSIAITGVNGFEVTPGGEALAVLSTSSQTTSNLYSINLTTGAVTPIGTFPGTSAPVRDITSLPKAETVFAVSAANSLLSFRSNAPGTLLSNRPILGLQQGETIRAIAFRPRTLALYGLGSTGRLYTIDPGTGTATSVTSQPTLPSTDGPAKASIDFIADTDRLRVVTANGQDFVVDPDLGTATSLGSLSYVSSDPAAGFPPSVSAEAFSVGTSPARLFGIDSARDSFVARRLDGSFNTTGLITLSPLGHDVTSDSGLDVAADGVALATLTDIGASTSTLYRVNSLSAASPSTITLTGIGTVGGGSIIRDMAVAPIGVSFNAASYSVLETAGLATITVTRPAADLSPLRVSYTTFDGTARAGVDYTAVSGTIAFGQGETTKTFTVPIRAGSFLTGTRTVSLRIDALDDSGAVVSGTTRTAVLTIVAAGQISTPGISSTLFRGSATSISSVDISFNASVDPAQAGNLATYLVRGVTSDRSARTFTIPISSVVYDPTTLTAHVIFKKSIALSTYRTLQVTATGLGTNGADAVVTSNVLRGTVVRYLDAEGNRVALGVTGRNARIVVLRRADGGAASAFVEGPGRTVYGLLIARRGSSRKTRIDSFATNGAQLRLPSSIVVGSSGIKA